MSLSLEDQMVDRWLFHDYQQACLSRFPEISCKAGWFPLPGGYKVFEADFPVEASVAATDFTSYDWTWTQWLVEMLTNALLNLPLRDNPFYERAVRSRIAEVLGPAFTLRLPNGLIFRQRIWGIMKSGWFLTLIGNSNCVEMIMIAAWFRASIPLPLPRLWTLGDDMIMRLSRELLPAEQLRLIEWVEASGVVVKRYSTVREFAGFEFPATDVVDPAYDPKHRFVLEHSENLMELVDSLSLIYGLSQKDLGHWLRQRQSRPPLVIQAWARGVLALPKPV